MSEILYYKRDSFQFQLKTNDGSTGVAVKDSTGTTVLFFNSNGDIVGDGQDTYGGEFALIDGDSHYPSNSGGSYNEYTD